MVTIPPVMIAHDGRGEWPSLGGSAAPVYLRDLDLTKLRSIVEAGRRVDALDLDSISGLAPDIAAARYVTRDLQIGIVATRRPSTACWVAEHGRTALLHVSALDSTGLGRGLTQHPGAPVGTVISPGSALKYLGTANWARLVRPIVAYGLILSAMTAMELRDLADGVIVARTVAEALERDRDGGR